MFVTKKETAAFLVNYTHRKLAFFQQPLENREIVGKPKKNMVPGSWPGTCETGDSPSCRRLRHLTCLSGLLATRNEQPGYG